jgi:hypothetical protein
MIMVTDWNVFGGFTPLEWKSRQYDYAKADPSLKSFLFALKSPQNVPPRRFALKANDKDCAINCNSGSGPHF